MKRASLGALALVGGIGALTWAADRRIARREDLTLDDAPEGEFATLPDGALLHFRSFGAGDRHLILIHGILDSTASWDRNVAALSRSYRVWAIDLIGFGYSARVLEPVYSLKYYARTIHEFMDAQGIARASVVGHSLGGAVALEFAHDFPEQVDRLVLIAPGTYWVNLPPIINRLAGLPVLPRIIAGLVTLNGKVRIAAFRAAFRRSAEIDEAQIDAIVRTARVRGSADALVAMLRSPKESDLPRGLERVAAPALILWGDRDSAIPRLHVARHDERLPNSRVVILPGLSHVPHIEQPEQVNEILLDFLRES